MKAYIHSGIQAASIRRIVRALGTYAPRDVTLVPVRQMADLVVHTVVGVQNFSKAALPDLIAADTLAGRRYAVVQCCIASTERPEPAFWVPIWRDALSVWSYLDLVEFAGGRSDFPFYHAPLGADGETFRLPTPDAPRPFTMLTSGYVAESEGVREAAEAVGRVNGSHVHLGPDLDLGPHSQHTMDISDARLAELYGRCKYVAGLRRCEGFELPAAEGLLCGARPIMFDAPHYRRWFGTFAEYVPEGGPEAVTDAIADILGREWRPVTPEERHEASILFSWERVVGKFWDRILDRARAAA